MKCCAKCKEVKALDQFYKRSKSKDGLQAWCKPCSKGGVSRFLSESPGKKQAYAQTHYLKNSEEIKIKTSEYYYSNRDSMLQACKEYRKRKKNDPHWRAIRTADKAKRRAARMKATPKWSDLKAIKHIYTRAQQLSIETGIPHQVDHIVPLRHPKVCGLHVLANLQILTAEENMKKHNRLEG